MSDEEKPESGTVEYQKHLIATRCEEGIIPEKDADLLSDFADAIYSGKAYPQYQHEGEVKEMSKSTTLLYMKRLRTDIYQHKDLRLSDTTADEINRAMADLDENRARGTTMNAQSALRHFFRYHDLGVDAEEIAMFKQESGNQRVDPETLPTADEIDRLREGVDAGSNPVRDRAILEVFVNTGQRLEAVRTLKLDEQEAHEKPGYIQLNGEIDGLKGARKRGRKRPIFHGRKALREWIDRHPYRSHEDPYLFVGNPNHHLTDPDEPLGEHSVRRALKGAAKRAGLDPERFRPHDLRHYWATKMRSEENLTWDEIRALGGWAEDSNIAQRVYTHIEESEYHRSAEEKLGVREADEADDSARTKPCEICGETIKPDKWDECPNCDEALGPGAESTQDLMARLVESAAKADGEAADGALAASDLLDSDPSLKEEIKAELKEEIKADLLDDL